MEIIVIGGGIGGLAAAIALRQAGHEVTVLEQAAELREVGAGLAVWSNGLRALDHLGVGHHVRALGVASTDGWLRTDRGERLLPISTQELRARHGELGLLLHRAELHDVLRAALGSAELRTGAALERIEEHADTMVAVLSDGRRFTGDALIGADGIRSRVRTYLHGEQPLRYAGYTAWRAVVRFPRARLLTGESWGAGARFGIAALRMEQVYVYATANVRPGTRGKDGEKAELKRIFGGWHEPIPDLLDALVEEDILRNDVYDLPPLRRWGRGRITLLGDAAHPMTPNLGQGACQALEDAVVLGRWLKESDDVVMGLRGYEAERRPRASTFVRDSYRAGWLGQLSGPLAVRVRNAFARRVLPRLQPRQLAALRDVTF
jgi:2-polyprenyl-6-methoxyphenol hydroxylase-like FAD-dependent oxidoreductase